MNQFDQYAATWNFEAMRKERTQVVADAITENIPLQPEWRVMEYGAGTGALSLLLKDAVGEILMADNSSEMVKVMCEKVEKEAGFATYSFKECYVIHKKNGEGRMESFSDFFVGCTEINQANLTAKYNFQLFFFTLTMVTFALH